MLSQSRELEQDYRDGKSAAVLNFPVPASDTGLVAALRSEHPQGRRVLCERYSAELLRIASRILGPDPGVRTAVVETLRWAVTHLDDLDDPRSLSAWLCCRLVVLTRRRLLLRRVLHGLTDGGGAQWSDAERGSEQLSATYRALDRLSVDRRLSFCLVVMDSMRWAEAATALQCDLPVVKARLVAAHAAFRDTVRRSFPQLLRWHSSVARLAAELAAEQDRRLADIGIYDFELLPPHAARLRPWAFAVPLSLCALLAVGFACIKLWGSITQADHSSGVGTWMVSPPQQSTSISFSNGPRITLAPGSQLRMLTSTESSDASVLESGSVTLSLGKEKETKVHVAAGPFLITVSQGTTEVSWMANSESLKVLVHRGVATISGCQFGLGSPVEPGKALDTRCVTRDILAEPSEPPLTTERELEAALGHAMDPLLTPERIRKHELWSRKMDTEGRANKQR